MESAFKNIALVIVQKYYEEFLVHQRRNNKELLSKDKLCPDTKMAYERFKREVLKI